MNNFMKHISIRVSRQKTNRGLRALVVYAAVFALVIELVAPIPAAYAADTSQQTATYTLKGTINNCGTMQGGASDGQFLYYTCARNNKITIVKMTTDGKVVTRSKTFSRSQLGHANDMTYNSRLQRLVVSAWDTSGGGNKVRLVDPNSFEITGTLSTSNGNSTSNICYNATTDQYLISGRIYDSKLNALDRIYTQDGVDEDADLSEGKILNQGIECDANLIYVMRVVAIRNKGYNVIAVYNWSGENMAVYKIENLNDEGENMALVNGGLYMGVNEGLMSDGGNSNNDYFIQLSGVMGSDSVATGSCTSGGLEEGVAEQYMDYGIGHYGNECVCTEGSGGMTGDTNFAKIATYFSSKGLKDIAISGILANLHKESTLSPFSVQSQPNNTSDDRDPPSGGGYGIAQFTPATKIAKQLKSNSQTSGYYTQYYSTKYGGYDIKTWNDGGTGIPEGVPAEVNDAWLKAQLEFFYKGEMQSTKVGAYRNLGGSMGLDYIKDNYTILEALNAAKNEKDAARIFVWIYERPLNKPGAASEREKIATEMLGSLNDIVGEGLPVSSIGNDCGDTAVTGDLTETVLAFAWEDGRRSSAQKGGSSGPYAKVIKQSKYGNDAAHKYGNDCGAFVYNLMVTSGFEPDYPPTYTGQQQPWLDDHWDNIADPGKVNVADLRPGDVGIVAGDHVLVWVGDLEGFEGKSAEAALGSNVAPTAVLDSNTYSAPAKYTWYRKKAIDAN